MRQRKKVAIILLVCLFSAFHVAAQSDTLSFLHISDSHLIFDFEKIQPDLAGNRKGFTHGQESFNRFCQNVPQQTNADFVVFTGDLIDFYEGETKNNEMFGTQIEQFAQMLKACNIPVYATLGNHDIVSYSWDTARVTSQSKAPKARKVWKRNLDCFQNGIYYSHDYNVGQTNYRIIFLDDSKNLFRNNKVGKVPFLGNAQLRWLKRQLNESSDDIEIVLMHIPFFQQEPDEKVNKLYATLSSHPSVKMVMAGHNHKNRILNFSAEGVSFFQVQTAGLANNSEAWRLIRLTEKNILVSVQGKEESELIIKLENNERVN
jgi:3',5'-cyclic AMP phosphodiesterase CpdA